jgi:CHAD domain-containing protein
MSSARLLALGRSWLDSLRTLSHAAQQSDDPEHVHQMRSTLRRLRALNRLIMAVGDGTRRPAREAFDAELRWLAGALGSCRNHDVLVTEALPGLVADLAAVSARRLRRAAAQARDVEFKSARTVLAGSRCAALLDLGDTVLDGSEETAVAPTGRRIRRAWKACVKQDARRARKAARWPGKADDEYLHALRIRVRKLRYLLELGAAGCGSATLDQALKTAIRLQSGLGALQDLAVARTLLAGLAEKTLSGRAGIAAALALENSIAQHRERALKNIKATARRFHRLPVFE